MKKKIRCRLLQSVHCLLGGLLLCGASAVGATSLPGAVFNDNLGAGTYNWPCTAGQGCTYGGPVTISQYYADGKGSLSLSGFQGVGGQLSFSDTLTYYAEVVGPNDITVPVDFEVSGQATTSGTYDVVSGATAYFNGVSTYTSVCAGGGNCNGPTNASFGSPPSPFEVTANTHNTIQLQVSGLLGVLAGSGATFSATVDPSVEIDPSFTTAGYSLVFSPDLNPVPIPSSIWLMLSGLIGLGFAGRRRLVA